MKIFHSDKGQEAFEKFFINWDERVETHDDLETQNIIKQRLRYIDKVCNELRTKMEDKIFDKHKDNPDKAADEYQRLMDSDTYNNLKKSSDNAVWLIYTIQNVYELKNRRTTECFKLRAELAELKSKVK